MADWLCVGNADDLQPNSGVCALVEGKQIAIFFMPKENAVYALDNYDPIGKANVLSRGIIGDIKGEPVVASPLYKQHYSLLTGQCLEDRQYRVAVHAVRILDNRLEIRLSDDDTKSDEVVVNPEEATS